MSMTLLLWKGPVVRETDEAEALLKPFYEAKDDGAFEASPDLAAVADELRRRYPYRLLSNDETVAAMSEEERRKHSKEDLEQIRGVEGGEPWSDLPFYETDRLLVLDIRWGADDQVIEDICALAREHRLVLYDPQGPDVHLPDDPIDDEPGPKPGVADYAKVFAIVAIFAALTWAAWQIPIGWLRWTAAGAGAFLTIASLVIVYATIEASRGKLDSDP